MSNLPSQRQQRLYIIAQRCDSRSTNQNAGCHLPALRTHRRVHGCSHVLWVVWLQDGTLLVSEKPETEAVVKEKMAGLHAMWEELESTTQTKAQCLFDANKAELFTQSCADLDKWMGGLEGQIQSDDYGKDLTSVNILLKKQQVGSQWS